MCQARARLNHGGYNFGERLVTSFFSKEIFSQKENWGFLRSEREPELKKKKRFPDGDSL